MSRFTPTRPPAGAAPRLARRSRLAGLATTVAVAATLVAAPAALATGTCPATRWVGAWAASPSDTGPSMTNLTFRMIVKPHRSGDQIRVRFTNRFGDTDLTIGAARVSQVDAGGAINPATTKELRFNGSTSVTIPKITPASDPAPSAPVPPVPNVPVDPATTGDRWSDLVSFDTGAPYTPTGATKKAFPAVAVDIYVVGKVNRPTRHKTALQTSYRTDNGKGNQTGWPRTGLGTANPFENEVENWYFVSGVDVMAPGDHSAVVALGDSLSDGTGSGPDDDERYEDWLQRSLNLDPANKVSVLNAGIGGNRILRDGFTPNAGPSMKSRLAADAVAQSGVTDVLLLAGANDMGQYNAELGRFPRSGDVTHGLSDMIEVLHRAKLKVILVTIPPTGGAWVATYGEAWMGNDRRQVNTWIRANSGPHTPPPADANGIVHDRLADGYWDLSDAIRARGSDGLADWEQEHALRSWDHVHPNGAGYEHFIDYVFGRLPVKPNTGGTPGLLKGQACAQG